MRICEWLLIVVGNAGAGLFRRRWSKGPVVAVKVREETGSPYRIPTSSEDEGEGGPGEPGSLRRPSAASVAWRASRTA